MEFDLIKELNKKLDNKYKFLKLLKVVYDTTFSLCQVNFIYPETEKTLSASEKDEITNAVSKVLNIKSKVECKFNKSFLDENLVVNKVKEFLKINYESTASYISDEQINYDKQNIFISVSFYLNKMLFDYFINEKICDKLRKFLEDNFCSDFVVGVNLDENAKLDESILEERAIMVEKSIVAQTKTPRYKVEDVIKVFGTEILPMPEYIKNIEGDKESVILAGYVEAVEEKEYIPRKNKEKGSDEKRKYYTFKLNDSSAIIDCIHFCTKISQKHFSLVQAGEQILCLGNVKKRDNGTLQYSIRSISLCKIVNASTEEEKIEEEIDGLYKYVKPTPYIQMTQDNFLVEKVEYPEYILNNNFVVFDVETTGLNPTINDITEIGAVKIINGQIKEKFQVLCKPHDIISAEITKITGITNEMVANKPLSTEVILDFLTFTKDCILVGYNVDFDYNFIQNVAKRVEKVFENEKHDCLVDAKNKLFLNNYKLGTVVASLGITLENAHRALFDATATAEEFLKLSTM